MSLDDKLDDLLEAGEITLDDASTVQTFEQFLSEAPRPPLPYESEPGFHGPVAFEDPEFQRRWGGYMRGKADGPEDP